jgi:hypothetical protein
MLWLDEALTELVHDSSLRTGGHHPPEYAGADVDCRLLFIGDRYRLLLRTYPEVLDGGLK